MNRIAVRPAPDPAPLSPDAVARFDDHGRLLTASAAFVLMLEQDYLADEILSLPRALALRAVCGGSGDQRARHCTRRFLHRGTVYRLEASFGESPAASEGVALSMTVEADRAPGAPPRRSWKPRRTSRRNVRVRLRPRTGAAI